MLDALFWDQTSTVFRTWHETCNQQYHIRQQGRPHCIPYTLFVLPTCTPCWVTGICIPQSLWKDLALSAVLRCHRFYLSDPTGYGKEYSTYASWSGTTSDSIFLKHAPENVRNLSKAFIPLFMQGPARGTRACHEIPSGVPV